MKKNVLTIFSMIILFALGTYLGGKYLGRGEVIATVCVIGSVAMGENYLSEYDFLSLAERSGKEIRSKYPLLANALIFSDSAVSNASEHSQCSKILVALNKGMK